MLLTGLLAVLLGVVFDYYFDLNDDALIKDILAGVYTGVPEGHNIQMQYPLSLLISLLYRICRPVDWFGLYLCLAQYGCLLLILNRLWTLPGTGLRRITRCALALAVTLSAYTSHLVFVQYSMVCGLLCATAAFLILTAPLMQQVDSRTNEGNPMKRWGRWNLPGDLTALVLIWLAFLTRSEMCLLMLPMVAMAMLFRVLFLFGETLPETAKTGTGKKCSMKSLWVGEFGAAFRYGCLILVGIVCLQMIHVVGYGSADWKKFNAFFDNRTELYDFQYIPEYQEHRAFYESIGLSEPEAQLLVNYNFGLDEEIEENTVGEIAAYAADHRQQPAFGTRLAEAVRGYVYRLHHTGFAAGYLYPMTDAPWNILVVLLYLGIFLLGLLNRNVSALLSAALLFVIRSGLWGYILMRGRDPIRITHGLYLTELLVLAGILICSNRNLAVFPGDAGDQTGNQIGVQNGKEPGNARAALKRSGRGVSVAVAAMLAMTAFLYLPSQMKVTAEEGKARVLFNQPYETLQAVCAEHPENLYLMDVYTSVGYDDTYMSYSERMFDGRSNELSNLLLLGGWADKSPLEQKKLAAFGQQTMAEALLSDNGYLVLDVRENPDWLKAFYEERGIPVTITQTEIIAEHFGIYEVRRAQ